jgi:hypothetical protein
MVYFQTEKRSLAMEGVGKFYGLLVCFIAISHNLWLFGIFIVIYLGTFSPVLVYCTKKNLSTLVLPPETKRSNNLLQKMKVPVAWLDRVTG